MKILIQNSGYHLKNLGDLAMLEAAYREIRSLQPDADILIYTTDASRLELCCPSAIPVSPNGARMWARVGILPGRLGVVLSQRAPLIGRFWLNLKQRQPKLVRKLTTSPLFSKYEREKIQEHWNEVNEADVVIATGGGYLNTTFFAHGRIVALTLSLASHLGKKIACFGQGVGPFQGHASYFEETVAKLCSQCVSVGFREDVYSSFFVKKHNLKNTTFTFDDATLSFPANYKKGHSSAEEKKRIGVNLRIVGYSTLDKEFSESFARILNEVSEKNLVELVPLPVATGGFDSDIIALESLQESLSNCYCTEVSVDTVSELVDRAKQCSIIVTCSYHAGVFGACSGVPVILISANGYYDQKLEGLRTAFDNNFVEIIDVRSTEWQSQLLETITKYLHSLEQYKWEVSEVRERYRKLVKSLYSSFFS